MPDQHEASAAIRILICEDDLSVAGNVAVTLKDLGYETIGMVATGEEAIRIAEQVRPDLILMDINLAGEIDGIEAVGQIRAQFDIPVVYLTAFAENDAFELAKQTEPYGYVGKPIRLLELRCTVETALSKHQADRKVRESEKRFHKVFEQGPIGMGLVGTDGRFLLVNSQLCQMLGYTEDELNSLTFVDITHPDHVTKDLEGVRLLYAGEIPYYKAEKRYIKKDGGILWGNLTAAAIRDADGKVLYTLPMIEDITDRKRAEEALRASEAQLSNAVKMAHLGPWEYDVDKDLFTFDDHFYNMFRTTAEQVGGYTMSSAEYARRFVHPDDLSVVADETRNAIETSDPFFNRQLEHRMLYADGEIGHISVRFFIVKDSTGQTIKTYGVNQDITERKRAEEALRQSQEMLSLALDGANLGIWDWDLTTGKALWDERALLVLGYDPNEFKPDLKNWKKLVHPDDWPRISENLNLHLEGNLPTFEAEYRVLNKSGDWLWAHAQGKVIEFDADGKPTRMTGVVADVTQRVRAAAELHKREELLRAILVASPIGIVLTQDSRIKWANDAWVKMFGFTSEDEYLDQPTSVMHSGQESYERYRTILYEGLTSGQVSEADASMKRKDGTSFDSHIRISLMDYSNPSKGTISTITDISERKKAEEALRTTSEEFEAVIQASPLSIIAYDRNSIVKLWNPASENIFGWSASEAIGKVLPFIPDDKKEEHVRIRERALKGERLTGIEARRRTKDGSTIVVSGSTAPLHDPEGRITGVMAVFMDITESKKAEEALAKSEELQRTILATSPVGIGLSVGRNMVWINDAWKEMFGLGPNDVAPFSINARALYPTQEEFARVGKVLYEGLEAGQANETDGVMIRKDGTIFHVHIAMKAVDPSDPSKGTIAAITDITGRKQVEEALHESQQKYRMIFEHAPLGILHFDQNGVMLDFNDRFVEMIGAPREKLIAFNMPERQKDERMRRAVLDALDGKTSYYEGDYLSVTGGKLTPMRAFYSPVLSDDGRFLGAVGIFEDVTDRKQAEEALRESMELMQYIVRNDPNAIAVYDRDLHYLAVSNRYLLDYNVKEEDIIGKHHYEVFPEMPQRWKDVHQRCLLGAVESEDDDYFERPDGSVTHNRWECRPWYRSGGEIGGIITYTEVTTERKLAEKALKESEARYRHLFDNSPVGIISVDTEGQILEVNQTLLEIIGSPSLEATKRVNMFELPQLVESGISDAFRSCMKTGERALHEFPYVSTWGKQSHLRIVLTPVTNQERTIRGCQATVEDTAPQRALEEQLRQAQKMEAVGILAGGIAHDFNNVLHIISGHAELLDIELVERKLKFGELDAIRQAAKRGADLVKQILTFSRKIDAKFESINLNEEVRSTERLLYRTIPKMIEIDLRLEEGLDRVRADSTQIEQMLINLAVNATDAMPEGGILAIDTRNVNLDEHYCKSHAEIVPGQYVLLKVSDTGHGMEEDVRQHIFEPFFTTKGLADGTGLGLATVFGIVKMHGGHVICESEVGKGTTFEIYFPVAEIVKPRVAGEQEVTAVAGGTETILVVDDEPMIRDLAERILDGSGYSVLTAGSGKEGIEIYAQHKSEISLVILDLIMPEMGGKQCLEELLKINPQVKALIASGFAVKGDTKAFLDTEAKGIVPKPFNMRELLRSVRHVLDGI